MENNIIVRKAYIKENSENTLHYLYENKNKNLLLRSKFDLNKQDEQKSLEDFIKIIIEFETNGIEKYPKIEMSKSEKDSHNGNK